MKHLYAIIIFIFSTQFVNAQIVNIPDANFKAKLIAIGVDTNNDGNIQQSEALAKTSLYLSSSNISDLTGINAFTNLTDLQAANNLIINVSVFTGLNNLVNLNIYDNNISSLVGLSNLPNLKYFFCGANQLTNLTGIESLTSLETLDCSYNNITSFAALNNMINLKSLICMGCQLTSLPNLSPNTSIRILDCSGNYLSILSSINNFTNLEELYIRVIGLNSNSLNTISALINLKRLDIMGNQLSNITIPSFPNLRWLRCSNNNLTTLDFSSVPNLTALLCDYNEFNSLNLSSVPNLQYLECSNNNLTTLDFTNVPQLRELYCNNNQITNLDVIGLSNLWNLKCNNNFITTLNTGNLPLGLMECSYNNLTTLDISGNQQLETLSCHNNNSLISIFAKNNAFTSLVFFECPNLQYICADDYIIPYLQDTLNQYGYTNCHVNGYCSFSPGGTFYTIQGDNKYDSNNNGCNSNDINVPNLRLSFTNGINSGSLIDPDGNYHYDVQAGTQNITASIENPTYFNVSPTTATVSFPTSASPFTRNFCITANGTHNDLEVALLPIGNARPGFDANYKIIYKNKGTQAQNGSVSLSFNDAILDLVSALPTVNSQATNSLSWSFSNLLPFETREIALTLNVNTPMETPAVNGGDVLNYTTTIVGATDETPNDNTSTFNQTVVNSFDPNDKTCLEGTVISPSMVGQYVHYLIRFENTGTFAAENIVVKDMIDTTKFDIASLVPMSGSHPYVTRIVNTNQVEFIFENINLPFDDANNDGYVVFKIKTLPSLVEGNTFSNSANIYFDYNFPIVTNTATTAIQSLGTTDFDFGSVYSLSPVPAKNNLVITANQSINISSISIYNTLGQLVQVSTNPTETIDVSGLKTGSYFIKISSDRGNATAKFLKE